MCKIKKKKTERLYVSKWQKCYYTKVINVTLHFL